MNIAVTGGMGSGKSTVASKLAKMLCADCVSADLLCYNLLQPGQNAYEQIHNLLSSDFFLANGELNRSYLRKAIFSDDRIRQKVDALLHPLVRQEFLSKCEEAERQRVNVVAEIPLLFEKCWQGDFDTTLVVYADEQTCLKRIVERDLVSFEDAKGGFASQMPPLEKCKLADLVIDNSGSLNSTFKMLEKITQKIHSNKLFIGK